MFPFTFKYAYLQVNIIRQVIHKISYQCVLIYVWAVKIKEDGSRDGGTKAS